jgi:hypothetical protein
MYIIIAPISISHSVGVFGIPISSRFVGIELIRSFSECTPSFLVNLGYGKYLSSLLGIRYNMGVMQNITILT